MTPKWCWPHSLSSILNRVQLFLTEANKASVPISSTIVNEFGEACKQAFIKQFSEKRETEFRPRMSSIGKPLCQLQMEKMGAKAETPAYNSKMRFILGDLIEALAVAIIKSSGIKIDSMQEKVTHAFKNDAINGTYDVEIMGKIWDIKSASPYSFQYKFGEEAGYESLAKNDSFGYLAQGYLYSKATGKDFGGWIVINKSTGEWSVLETPINNEAEANKILEQVEKDLRALNSDAPFKRLFEDIEETFNKKPTGNRILGKECTFCAYKKACWENLEYLPQQQSKAINPKYIGTLKLITGEKNMTTVRSRKAKGRRLQNWVRDTLLKIFSNNGFLDENDIKCAVMGETGADIKLSNTAKRIIPYSFECKNKETFKGIYDIIDQAKSNSDKRETPIGIIKMNKQQPLAILDAEHFLKMIGKL